MPRSNKDDLSSHASKLSLSSGKSSGKPAPSKKKKEAVADSWEDEDVSGSDPDEDASDGKDDSGQATPKNNVPAPPPPTPMTPSFGPRGDWDEKASPTPGSPRGDSASSKRPEKTDAVARRLIAAGLGLKAPKQTDEQRAYQKSVREQEKKRREREKEEEQKMVDAEAKARAAVWDD